MRDVRRIRMHCILLVFLIVISALAGCSEKQPAEENGSIQMDESAVHDFSKKSFMSEEATTSLTEFRHEMDGTTYLFAVLTSLPCLFSLFGRTARKPSYLSGTPFNLWCLPQLTRFPV